ncbi:hypothetical protein [Chryseobacterium sp. GP-SGM7]|uniref:hypothetical protein n=1 Tax=Chryseobacterium sp. GP-SGM7 TaxID=3411323 RepID=UPI003B93C395
MKKLLLISVLSLFLKMNAQIGIGTTNPTEKLEIVGSAAIGTTITLDPTDYVNNSSGFTIVGIDPQSTIVNGKIIALETLYTPITVQPYTISNIYRDDLNDLNLNIPTDKYFITIANFEAIPNAGNNGIFTDISASTINKGHFVLRVFESGTSWHVNIGYPTLNTENTTDRYTYRFDIILYSKRFFKSLGEVSYDLNGSNSGTAVTAPTGI